MDQAGEARWHQTSSDLQLLFRDYGQALAELKLAEKRVYPQPPRADQRQFGRSWRRHDGFIPDAALYFWLNARAYPFVEAPDRLPEQLLAGLVLSRWRQRDGEC